MKFTTIQKIHLTFKSIWRYCQIVSEVKLLDKKTRIRFETRAAVIKALAHPTRLFIVDVLSRHEKCVCELTEMVGVDISTISKHLAVLRTAGLVEDDKRGLQVWYRLRTPCVINFFDCIESVIKSTGSSPVGCCAGRRKA